MSRAFFSAMPPQLTISDDLDAVLLEPVDDGQAAESRGFDQGPVDLAGRGLERLAQDEAGQPLVDEDGPVAVVPVEGEKPGLAGLEPRRLRRERLVRALDPAARLDIAYEPVEDVAHGGLARLESEVARQDRAVDDPAEPGNIGQGFRVRPDGDVAGARPDDLDQPPRRDPGSHGPEMGVKSADGDRDPGGKLEAGGPGRDEAPGADIGGVGLGRKAGGGAHPAWGRAWPGNPRPAGRPRRR